MNEQKVKERERCLKDDEAQFKFVFYGGSMHKVRIDGNSTNAKGGKKHGGGFFFSSKHHYNDRNHFAWRMEAKFKEGHLDGEIFVPALVVGDGPRPVKSTHWEDGRLVSDHHSVQESLALERAGEEIEQMREIDSRLDEGLN